MSQFKGRQNNPEPGLFRELLNEDLENSENAKRYYTLSETTIPKDSILQIKSIVNVSLPKKDQYEREGAYDPQKNVLKISLTDGQGSCTAIIYEAIPKLSSQTPPGTKLRTLRSIPNTDPLIKLNRDNCEILGGNVSSLVEKWKMLRAREMNEQWGSLMKSSDSNSGPPPWKRFGQRINVNVAEIRNAKAMDIVNKQKDEGGAADTEFESQRKDAISELAKQSSSKQFGCAKPLLEKDLQDIVNKGFSQQEAEEALSKYKNAQKALRVLQESKFGSVPKPVITEPRKPPKPKKKSKFPDEEEDDETEYRKQAKPTQSVSLFGFIQDKIELPNVGSLSVNESNSADMHTERNDDYNSYGYKNGRDNYQGNRERGGRSGGGRGYSRGGSDRGSRGEDRGGRGGYDRGRGRGGSFQSHDNFRGGSYNSSGRGRGGDSRGDTRNSDRGGRGRGSSYNSEFSQGSYQQNRGGYNPKGGMQSEFPQLNQHQQQRNNWNGPPPSSVSYNSYSGGGGGASYQNRSYNEPNNFHESSSSYNAHPQYENEWDGSTKVFGRGGGRGLRRGGYNRGNY